MTDAHAEMHGIYNAIKSIWRGHDRPITRDDVSGGWPAEVIRWCRDPLGGHDEDLLGPERAATAARQGWSAAAAYSCLPSPKPRQTWSSWIHDVAHWLYPKLPADRRDCRYGSHDVGHAEIEMELTKLVVGWLTDAANGAGQSFPPLDLKHPSDFACGPLRHR